MTDRDTIIRMAREADATGYGDELTGDAIERFAALIAAVVKAEEREACAKVCESFKQGNNATYIDDDWADMCAAAIRERGETTSRSNT